MARYVIDAPTLLHIVANDLEIDPGHRLAAPDLIRSQALSRLLDAVRRGELDETEALRRHERLTELTMRLLGDRASRRTAWTGARVGLDVRCRIPGGAPAAGRCARHDRSGTHGEGRRCRHPRPPERPGRALAEPWPSPDRR